MSLQVHKLRSSFATTLVIAISNDFTLQPGQLPQTIFFDSTRLISSPPGAKLHSIWEKHFCVIFDDSFTEEQGQKLKIFGKNKIFLNTLCTLMQRRFRAHMAQLTWT